MGADQSKEELIFSYTHDITSSGKIDHSPQSQQLLNEILTLFDHFYGAEYFQNYKQYNLDLSVEYAVDDLANGQDLQDVIKTLTKEQIAYTRNRLKAKYLNSAKYFCVNSDPMITQAVDVLNEGVKFKDVMKQFGFSSGEVKYIDVEQK
ncbi:Hypothetical_protein [Hexamita inflata]|uniref:Hypothetical_protein n=1 Tax=Hexamita inflata TaxID=28002 RepID=A0ABP1J5C8_9EUKA